MTLDEAIKYFEEMVEIGETYDVSKIVEENRQLLEWLKDYKRLLEQQSCGDVISRRAVLDLINADWKYEGLEEDVSSLPPVTPQPKTGRWIYVGNSEVNGLKICKCSNCEKKTYGSHKYCPNCGAKMVEPQESEDKCKNCEYYHNPDYTRCHECKAESEVKE